jgi:hypothetical protein
MMSHLLSLFFVCNHLKMHTEEKHFFFYNLVYRFYILLNI